MKHWMEAAGQIGRLLLGQPQSSLELAVAVPASAIILLIALKKAGSAFGARNTGFGYVLLTATAGIALMLAAMTAAKLYLPWWDTPSLHMWILAGSGIAVSLVVIAPFICALQKVSYVGALFSWLLSLLSVAIVIALVSGIFQMLSSGAGSMEKGLQHKRQIEDALH